MTLYTAQDIALAADVAEADQSGEQVDKGMEIYSIEHPPFITVTPAFCHELDELTPPDKLVADWNRLVPEMELMEAWQESNYEQRYKEYLEDSFTADKQLEELSSASDDGGVCLISGSTMYPLCPRRILYEMITGKEVYHG